MSDEGVIRIWLRFPRRLGVKDAAGRNDTGATGAQMHKQALFNRQNHSIFVFRQAPPFMEREMPGDVSMAKLPFPPYTGAAGWECSAYYYWWLFIRENPRIRDFLTSGAEPRPGTVAYDFRRVFKLNFREWWETEGRYLFCEPKESGIEVVMPPVSEEGLEDRLLVSIPFRGDIEQTLVGLRKLLSENASAFKSEQGVSRARYPVIGKPVLTALHKRYRVWRLRRDMPEMTNHAIADEIEGIDVPGDPADTDVKNRKAAIVSRYYSEAKMLIDHAGMGLFPVMHPKQIEGMKVKERRPT